MKKSILFTIILTSNIYLFGQQIQQFSQNLNTKFVYNPGATGSNYESFVFSGFRKQWMNFGLEPTTAYIGFNKCINNKISSVKQPLALRTSKVDEFHNDENTSKNSFISQGIGFLLISDSYGAFKTTNLNFSYALHKKISNKIKLGAGLKFGYQNVNFDQTKAVPENLQDALYEQFITNQNLVSTIDINLGIYIYNSDYYLGYSTSQLPKGRLFSNNFYNNYLITHHSLIGGYIVQINEKLSLTPNFNYRMVKNAPNSLNINLKAELNKKYFASVGVRNHDAVILMAGLNVTNKLSFFYSYDANTSLIRNYSIGGNELNITYKF